MRVPFLIRRHDSPWPYLWIWAPFIALYQIASRWPLREPMELPFLWVDRLVPFVPQLLPLYIAYLPFFWWTVTRSENDREANRVFYATHLQLALSLPFFLLLPVQMPPNLFYSPETYGWADTFWRWFDGPNACFPSLHASNCLLLIQLNWNRRQRTLHTIFGVGIIASTVLVKQHYVVDLLGGVTVYLAAYWCLARVRLEGGPLLRYRSAAALNDS